MDTELLDITTNESSSKRQLIRTDRSTQRWSVLRVVKRNFRRLDEEVFLLIY